MFKVVICTVSSGRVSHKFFTTWDAARQHADIVTEQKGSRVRIWLEQVETPTRWLNAQPSRAA
jgi:hypothetical protein